MKKILSLILSIIMVFSCASVFAGALDLNNLSEDATQSFLNGLSAGLNGSINLDDGSDVEAMLKNGMLNDVDMFGLSVDFLYNKKDDIYWPSLTVTRDEIALTKANINTYLSTAIADIIGDYESSKFITARNATKLANYIGHILDPDFSDVVISDLSVENDGFYFDSFDVRNVFYTKIARYSGLTARIKSNWIDANVNFSPLLYLLNFNFKDDQMLGKSKLSNAERIAPVLVKSVIKSVCEKGPLEYVLEIVARLASTYATCMYAPIAALVQPYISKGVITEDELRTLRGLFNLIVNGNDKSKITSLQFISAPAYRFATCVNGRTVDTTQMFLYGIIYLTLVGKYGSNSVALNSMKAKVNSNGSLNSTQKQTICSIYDGIIGNDLDSLVSNMSGMMGSNIDQVGDTLWSAMINFFKQFWEKIARVFNRLFDSMVNFGDF